MGRPVYNTYLLPDLISRTKATRAWVDERDARNIHNTTVNSPTPVSPPPADPLLAPSPVAIRSLPADYNLNRLLNTSKRFWTATKKQMRTARWYRGVSLWILRRVCPCPVTPFPHAVLVFPPHLGCQMSAAHHGTITVTSCWILGPSPKVIWLFLLFLLFFVGKMSSII